MDVDFTVHLVQTDNLHAQREHLTTTLVRCTTQAVYHVLLANTVIQLHKVFPQGLVMQAIFVSSMQQGQHRHLSLVFWNGAGCALQDLTVLVGQHMKGNAHQEHTG